MFAIRATVKERGNAAEAPENYARYTGGSLTVDTRTDGLFSFCFELDRGVAIGEALTPIDRARIQQITANGDAVITD